MRGSRQWFLAVVFMASLLMPPASLFAEETQDTPESPALEPLSDTDREIIEMLDLLQALTMLQDMEIVAMLEDKK